MKEARDDIDVAEEAFDAVIDSFTSGDDTFRDRWIEETRDALARLRQYEQSEEIWLEEEKKVAGMVGAICGLIATIPWLFAGIGWAASWNAYINLLFTLGGFVLWATLFSALRSRR